MNILETRSCKHVEQWTFFDLHSGRVDYMDTVIHDVPNSFT